VAKRAAADRAARKNRTDIRFSKRCLVPPVLCREIITTGRAGGLH